MEEKVAVAEVVAKVVVEAQDSTRFAVEDKDNRIGHRRPCTAQASMTRNEIATLPSSR